MSSQVPDASLTELLQDDVNAKSSYGVIPRFLVFLEQLEVAYGLLAEGSLAKSRTALVVVDNLASLLLHAHAERVFASGEGSRWYPRKRYTTVERSKILGDFDRMVALASIDAEGPSWHAQRAIVDAMDGEVMRVSHHYRNGVYHEDRHNMALLAPLTLLYAKAVGRSFCRSQEGGWTGYSVSSEQAARLREFGYEPRPDSFVTSLLMVDFPEAARQITENVAAGIEVDEDALRDWLAQDIVDRCVTCGRIIAGLLEDGMPVERLNFAFYWSQFWEARGADEQWLALEDERDRIADALYHAAPAKPDDAASAAYQSANDAYLARGHELQAAFTPPVGPTDPPRLAGLGERLRNAKHTASLLQRYRKIDQDVERLELATMSAVRAWDQIVEAEVDRIREA